MKGLILMEELLTRYPSLCECRESIEKALDIIIDTYENGGKILVCGNGGSAADSEHIVGELMKGFLKRREVTDERIPEELRKNLQGALPAISLTGKKESKLSEMSDVTIRVPETETYKVQELHLPVYHYLCAAAEEKFF